MRRRGSAPRHRAPRPRPGRCGGSSRTARRGSRSPRADTTPRPRSRSPESASRRARRRTRSSSAARRSAPEPLRRRRRRCSSHRLAVHAPLVGRRRRQRGADEAAVLRRVEELRELLAVQRRLHLDVERDTRLDERVAPVRVAPRDDAVRIRRSGRRRRSPASRSTRGWTGCSARAPRAAGARPSSRARREPGSRCAR